MFTRGSKKKKDVYEGKKGKVEKGIENSAKRKKKEKDKVEGFKKLKSWNSQYPGQNQSNLKL